MKIVNCLAFFALTAFTVSAAQFSFEGRLLENGAARANLDTVCTVDFYSSESGTDAMETLSAVPLKTDGDGNFVVSCAIPGNMPDVFWAGITIRGDESQISPRTRIAPSPFALSAVKAEVVRSDSAVEITGTAAIETLESAANVSTRELVLPPGAALAVKNYVFPNVYVDSIRLGDCAPLSLFNARGGALSPDYDRISADAAIRAEVKVKSSGLFNINNYYYDSTVHDRFTCPGDGFLLVAVKSEPRSCPDAAMSLFTGDVGLIENLNLPACTRLITVPCRKGDVFTLSLTAKSGGYSDSFSIDKNHVGSLSAKIKFVYFGF